MLYCHGALQPAAAPRSEMGFGAEAAAALAQAQQRARTALLRGLLPIARLPLVESDGLCLTVTEMGTVLSV
jgi:hypothetical protein